MKPTANEVRQRKQEEKYYTLLHKVMKQDERGGHNKTEYALTLDTAKEISMVEGIKSIKTR